MSLLSLEPKKFLNICSNDILYNFIDEVVHETSSSVKKMVTDAMTKPLELLGLFNEYSWLLDVTLEDYLENITIADPSPTYDDYSKEFEVLDRAILGITNLSFDYESYDLVRVATTSAKDTLLKAANDRKNGLASVLGDEARQLSVDVLDGYQDILNRIAVKPADERELASLREFIEVSKKTVEGSHLLTGLHLLTHLLTDSLTHSHTYSLTHILAYSLIYSLTYLLTHSLRFEGSS